MKKNVLSLMLPMLLLLITACSHDSSNISDHKITTEAALTTPASLDHSIIELNYLSHPDEKDVLKDIISDFESENPTIKVNLLTLPSSTDDKYAIIKTALENGDKGVDLFDADVTWPAYFVKRGWVLNFDDFYKEDIKKQFLPFTLLANEFDGHYYGIPYRTDAGVLFYRKDLLEKYKLTPPKNYNDLIDSSKQIMSSEPDVYGYAASWMQFEGLSCAFYEMLWGFDSHLNLSQDGVFKNRDKAIEALTLMSGLKNTQRITPDDIIYYDSGSARKLFMDGKLLFIRDWPTGWSKFQNPELSQVVGKVGMAQLPTNTQVSYSTLGGWQIMVSRFSQHPDAAQKFAAYRCSLKTQKLAAERQSYLPSLVSLYNDADLIEKFPILKDIYPIVSNAYPRPKNDKYPAISKIIQEECYNTFIHYKSPNDAIVSMENRIQAELSK